MQTYKSIILAVSAGIFTILSYGIMPYANEQKHNVIVILTDDQDVQSVKSMPAVQKHLAKEGVTFSQAFVSNSVCCPSRTSILRGQYPHNTGVLSNSKETGGFTQFMEQGCDRSNLATWYQKAGYETALMGKFLNGYPFTNDRTFVPQGWSEWFAATGEDFHRQSNYTINHNGTLKHFGKNKSDYMNDVLLDNALQFIQKNKSKPYFLYLATSIPHLPSNPPERFKGTEKGLKLNRNASFNEPDNSDKPQWVRSLPSLNQNDIKLVRHLYQKRTESLKAVDEMVEKIVLSLKETGQINHTLIVYMSDNGHHLGEHRIPRGKQTPYEEAIRVPLIVRLPDSASNVTTRGTVQNDVILNTDIGPTLVDYSKLSPDHQLDGRSFAKSFNNALQQVETRKSFLVEHEDSTNAWGLFIPKYRTLRVIDGKLNYMYTEYNTGESEFYDLSVDPFELENKSQTLSDTKRKSLSTFLSNLSNCVGAECIRLENLSPSVK